jgi:hypothetical protein
VCQGEQVKDPEGTRQKSDRNLGIRSAFLCKKKGRSERFSSDCLSKTQVPANS